MKHLARVAKIANVCPFDSIREKRANRPSRREADVQRRRLPAASGHAPRQSYEHTTRTHARPAVLDDKHKEHSRARYTRSTSQPKKKEGKRRRARGREGKRRERLKGGDRREVLRFSGNLKRKMKTRRMQTRMQQENSKEETHVSNPKDNPLIQIQIQISFSLPP